MGSEPTFLENLFYSPFNHLMWLLAWESFIEFVCYESCRLYKELIIVYFLDRTICIYMPVAALRYTHINRQNLKNLIFDTVLETEKNTYVRSICIIKSCSVFWTAGNTDLYVQFPKSIMSYSQRSDVLNLGGSHFTVQRNFHYPTM
jgi:hypothetical protein